MMNVFQLKLATILNTQATVRHQITWMFWMLLAAFWKHPVVSVRCLANNNDASAAPGGNMEVEQMSEEFV